MGENQALGFWVAHPRGVAEYFVSKPLFILLPLSLLGSCVYDFFLTKEMNTLPKVTNVFFNVCLLNVLFHANSLIFV